VKIAPYLPEIILVLTLLGLLLSEATHHGERHRLTLGISLAGIGANIAQLLLLIGLPAAVMTSTVFEVSIVTLNFKLLVSVAALLAVLISVHSKEVPAKRKAEFQMFVLGGALATDILLSSLNLIQVFIGVQLYSLVAFFLVAYNKRRRLTSEAAAKYLVFSVVAQAMLGFALALLFSFSGELSISAALTSVSNQGPPEDAMLLVFVFLLFVVAFFLGLFPAFLWVLDVAHGAAIPAGFWLFSTSPVVALALYMRVLSPFFGRVYEGQWILMNSEHRLIGVSAVVLSAIVGGLLALRQVALKRLIGGILVVQSAMLTAGLLTLGEVTFGTVVFYLWASMLTLAGLFGVLSFLQDHAGITTVDDLFRPKEGRARHVFLLVVFLLCSVAAPPSPLFVARFGVFTALLEAGHLSIVIALTIGWTLTLVAASRVAFSIYLQSQAEKVATMTTISSRGVFLYSLMIPLAFLTVFSDPIIVWLGSTLKVLFA
jgi:NADH-quinone oxidoreductase subunit N